MNRKNYISFFITFISLCCLGQQNSIKIKGVLEPEKNQLKIQQETIFYNNSGTVLTKVYFHNWANGFKDRKTPLSKRFIEDFRKDLYFAKEKNLGHSKVNNISVNFENVPFTELENQPDIIEIALKKALKPNDSLKITSTYVVKIPNAKFTGYGFTETGYHLRFWYLAPAVYKNDWHLMSNVNLDDLYENPTNFTIEIDIPNKYVLESNLYQYETKKDSLKNYYLVGQKKTDVLITISTKPKNKLFKTKSVNVHTDVFNKEIGTNLTTDILNRELLFLEEYLGKFPHNDIYVDKATQRKNPIYGLNQLPSFLRPFSDVFRWDLTFFKAISKKYIDNTLLLNRRKDYWVLEGIQNYLMLEYVERFYPEVKLLGNLSDKWLIRNFNISKLKFNDKYQFVYQFSSRQYLDQALTKSLDSLSNFNRRIVNNYKAGLGFKYLKEYLGEHILDESIKELYQKNKSKNISSAVFKEILSKKTSKKIDWFFGDYINTSKKIDYVIEKAKIEKDSIEVTIKNKSNITTPIALYGIKNKKDIVLKKWISDIDSSKTFKIVKGNFQDLALNFENLYPEHNTLNNWKSLENKVFNKPIKFSFYKDIENPNYNQLFYEPNLAYNFYNGVIFGIKIHNKPLITRNFEFKIAPAYAFKSENIIGKFSVLYNQFFEETNIYKIMYGVAGSSLDYAPNLSYRSLIPFVNIIFKRKSLRDAGSKYITAKILSIDKEVAPQTVKTEQDNYNIFSLSYNYSKIDMIKELRYNFTTEFANNFSKIATDIRYRSLTSSDTQLDFRFYAGTFLNNNSSGDYFSFGLDRANDYLFQLNYFGRSEESGIFSQQFIIAEGGFKSVLPTRFADNYMMAFNSSIGIWRWVEFYNDVAILKNKNVPAYFAYNNGIRFNFIHNIFEIYFPLYSNNGWEVSQGAYPQKIRFTITGDFSSIFNFFRRGLL
ncbi:MAG: aminopeptidase [Polaribacter sp.]